MDFYSLMLRRPHVADAQEADVDPLESCLLDRNLSIGTSTNATTTRYEIRHPDDNQRDIAIQVSLFVARPPRLSNILISCAGTQFTEQPIIVATFEGLVLLSIPFFQDRSSESQFFLYQPGAPSLYPIPQPSGDKRLDPQQYCACILPHGGNGDYLVTGLVNEEPGEFDLFLYSSLTHTWTIKRPVLAVPGDGSILHMTYNAIPVGGSMVAFVDIWTGILFCDVLDGESPKVHHLPLPSTSISKESAPRVLSVSTPRDVLIQKVSGSSHLCIRFVEVVCSPIFESWRVTSWSTTTTMTTPWCHLDGWRKYQDVCDLDLSVADGVCYDGLLPETSEWDSDGEEDGQRTLGSLYLDMPRMSLHQDNVVCFMAKRYMKKLGTWIIAVDMANKILQGVYQCVRLTKDISYSTVSFHVDMAAAPVVKGDLKRLGARLESYPQKKFCHEQMVSSPNSEQVNSIMATQDGDEMDLDQE
ncbi:hypothetical protein ACQ4PT_048428 [Festuca glaucescens]